MKLNEIKDENQQPEIIVLIGLPGSGKSTWKEKMLSKAGSDYTVISSDDIIEDFAEKEGKSYTKVFDKYIGRASKMAKQKFNEAIKNHENVIWDQTNLSEKKRRGILSQVPDGYKKIAVAFEVNDEELKRRLDKRASETGKEIPDHVLKNMAQSYQPPSESEGFDEVFIM